VAGFLLMLPVASIEDIVPILVNVAVFGLTEIVWFIIALTANFPQAGNRGAPSAKR
jgi:hypothetical protein